MRTIFVPIIQQLYGIPLKNIVSFHFFPFLIQFKWNIITDFDVMIKLVFAQVSIRINYWLHTKQFNVHLTDFAISFKR